MADFLKILESKIDFSPTERGVAERWFRQVERDSLFANSISSGGGGSGVTSLDAGNVAIDLSEGIVLRNPETGDAAVRLDADGDAWFGKNIGDPDTTTMFIISNTNLYNSEWFGEGDLLIGSNSSGKGNMWWDASAGKLYFRSGQTTSVEIGAGGIVATWGQIGGWSIDATRIYSANMKFNSANESIVAGDITLDGAANDLSIGTSLVFDGATEILTVGSGDPYIVIDGTNALIKVSDYGAGTKGWQIDSAGDAEFNNITARGGIKASTFVYEEISGIGGHLVVTKSAAELYEDVTTAATFTMKLKAGPSGAELVDTGDHLRIQAWNGTEVLSVWVSAGAPSTASGVTSFTATLQSGGTGKALQKGMAVINYGSSGGALTLQAGDPDVAATPTRLLIETFGATPWSGGTVRAIVGDLYGQYGAGTNHYYGLGIGDYSSGNYLAYNHDGSGLFELVGADGEVTIDSDGITLETGSPGDKNSLKWGDGVETQMWISCDDSTYNTGRIVVEGDGVVIDQDAWLILSAETSAAQEARVTIQASSPGEMAQIYLRAEGGTSSERIEYTAREHLFTGDIRTDSHLVVGTVAPPYYPRPGHIHLDHGTPAYGFIQSTDPLFLSANSQYNGSFWKAIKTGSGGTFYINDTAGLIYRHAPSVSAGGTQTHVNQFTVTQTGDLWASGHIKADDEVGSARTVRSSGSGGNWAGDGAEMFMSFGAAYFLGYDRTGGHYTPTYFQGDPVYLCEGGDVLLTVNAGDVYTVDWQQYATVATGWVATPSKNVWFKTIGDMVFVSAVITGTSNSATTTFSVPYNADSSGTGVTGNVCLVQVGSSRAIGYYTMNAGSNLVVVKQNAAGAAFPSSGLKYFWTQFFYQRA